MKKQDDRVSSAFITQVTSGDVHYVRLLQRLVNQADYPTLISTLRGLVDGTLRAKHSMVILQGGPQSGKTTLIGIMRKLASSVLEVPFAKFERRGIFPKQQIGYLERFNDTFIHLCEPFSDDDIQGVLQSFHSLQEAEGQIYIWKEEVANFHPGVVVTQLMHSQEVPQFKQLKKMPLIVNLPFDLRASGYTSEGVVDLCVKEFRNMTEH